MPPATAADLLADLERLRLLDAAQAAALRREALPAEPRLLAKALIDRGWLTPFQANLLLTGRGGELLLGPYLLLERLGQGGMGAVFKARHLRLGRVVALKVIRDENLGDATSV